MQNTGSEQSILLRVEKLERQNRALRGMGLVILVLGGAFFWMGQTAQIPIQRAIEARKFTLRDMRGKRRAELSVAVGRPVLLFYDANEQVSVSVGIDEDGPGITVYGPNQQRQAAVLLSETGPLITLHDSSGVKRLNLNVTPQGPAIGLLGSMGEAKGAFGMTANSETFLQLFGTAEHGGVQLFAAPDRSVVRMFDSSDVPRAVLGLLAKEGTPGLTLNDASGNSRVILMLDPKGPSVDFLDEQKKLLWKAP
jgi:hypothetical protein